MFVSRARPLFRAAEHTKHDAANTLFARPMSSVNHKHDDDCLFCKIIQKKIPSFGLVETELTYSFLDINPLSDGHALVIPKQHGVKRKWLFSLAQHGIVHEIDDKYLADMLPVAKRIVDALGPENYNILQNNGRLAHQQVMHVHFHIIPKPDSKQGLGLVWSPKDADMDALKARQRDVLAKLQA